MTRCDSNRGFIVWNWSSIFAALCCRFNGRIKSKRGCLNAESRRDTCATGCDAQWEMAVRECVRWSSGTDHNPPAGPWCPQSYQHTSSHAPQTTPPTWPPSLPLSAWALHKYTKTAFPTPPYTHSSHYTTQSSSCEPVSSCLSIYCIWHQDEFDIKLKSSSWMKMSVKGDECRALKIEEAILLEMKVMWELATSLGFLSESFYYPCRISSLTCDSKPRTMSKTRQSHRWNKPNWVPNCV